MAERADRQETHRSYVSYIDKSREYYEASGYDQPYRWAAFNEAPFTPLTKPLAECNVAVITTTYLHHHDSAHGAPATDKVVYHHPVVDRPARMFTDDLSWDKDATHTDDLGSFLPIAQLQAAAAVGRIRSISPRIYGVPTDYSQRRTRELDAPALLDLIREDDVDALILVPL